MRRDGFAALISAGTGEAIRGPRDWPRKRFATRARLRHGAVASIGSCSATGWRDINSALMPILFLIVFIDLVGFGLVIPLLPFYAERFAASPLQMTTLFATYSLMSMVTAPLWGRLSDRVGRRPVLMASMAAASLAYFLLRLASLLRS